MVPALIERPSESAIAVNLTTAELFSRTLTELLRCWTPSSFTGDNSDSDTLRLRSKMQKFYPIAEGIFESVGNHGYPCTGVDRSENARPTIMLLHDARFILHFSEDRSEVDPVLRIFFVH